MMTLRQRLRAIQRQLPPEKPLDRLRRLIRLVERFRGSSEPMKLNTWQLSQMPSPSRTTVRDVLDHLVVRDQFSDSDAADLLDDIEAHLAEIRAELPPDAAPTERAFVARASRFFQPS